MPLLKKLLIPTLFLVLFGCKSSGTALTPIPEQNSRSLDSLDHYPGYFDYYWDEKNGKIWVVIDKWDQEFLYLNALTAGVGSNDIGLDRGKMGANRVVKFIRAGDKALLMHINYDYRAESDNADERKSVEEAFAQSVLAGFKIEQNPEGKDWVDLSPLLMQDVFGVGKTLGRTGQGDYRIDPGRSGVYLASCKNFPDNSEFESLLTFSGKAQNEYIREVTPTPDAVTVRQRHSFIRLPDAGYTPRDFDPRSGYFALRYQDYAAPISESLQKRLIYRHRIETRKLPSGDLEVVNPLVYYVDRGAPEPIRSALVEGASWWAEAFESAGLKNAFRVEVLPEGIDPMDIRYNVIQWVHRKTRGWSYGHAVADPRTGEILKGHVSLGSLRVRQDYLIAQGLIRPFVTGKPASPVMQKMALARLRQLSAHEVGHTLGLAHNFSASMDGRASVMDYPHPLVLLNKEKEVDLENAYATGIGTWDKVTIQYGYQQAPDAAGMASLKDMLGRTPLRYLSDQDARPKGSANPEAHLWDNGTSAAKELQRVLAVREKAISGFGEENIRMGTPLSGLEEVFAPLYYSHRYQVEAAAKSIGGMYYAYAIRSKTPYENKMVSPGDQREALSAVLASLSPEVLAIPEPVLRLIPPRAMGYQLGRETLPRKNGGPLDPMAAAESAARHSLELLLHPQRLGRMAEFHARDARMPGVGEVMDSLVLKVLHIDHSNTYFRQIQMLVGEQVIYGLMRLAIQPDAQGPVKARAWSQLGNTKNALEASMKGMEGNSSSMETRIHFQYLAGLIERFLEDPKEVVLPKARPMPDGSPIGCGWQY